MKRMNFRYFHSPNSYKEFVRILLTGIEEKEIPENYAKKEYQNMMEEILLTKQRVAFMLHMLNISDATGSEKADILKFVTQDMSLFVNKIAITSTSKALKDFMLYPVDVWFEKEMTDEIILNNFSVFLHNLKNKDFEELYERVEYDGYILSYYLHFEKYLQKYAGKYIKKIYNSDIEKYFELSLKFENTALEFIRNNFSECLHVGRSDFDF